MEIKQDFENKLFKRQEIEAELESPKNPSFEEVKKFIAEKIGKSEENIEVRNVKGGFGKDVFHVDAYVYDSKKELDTMKELAKTKKQKKTEAEEAKKAAEEAKEEKATPAEEEPKPEEKPAEEPKSKEKPAETPAEDKPEQTEEKPAETPAETHAEDKPEEEVKAIKEEAQKSEEAK